MSFTHWVILSICESMIVENPEIYVVPLSKCLILRLLFFLYFPRGWSRWSHGQEGRPLLWYPDDTQYHSYSYLFFEFHVGKTFLICHAFHRRYVWSISKWPPTRSQSLRSNSSVAKFLLLFLSYFIMLSSLSLFFFLLFALFTLFPRYDSILLIQQWKKIKMYAEASLREACCNFLAADYTRAIDLGTSISM